jgi:hypothetical protein
MTDVDLIERLRVRANDVENNPASHNASICASIMREAAMAIERLLSAAGAVSQGESFRDIKDRVRPPPVVDHTLTPASRDPKNLNG